MVFNRNISAPSGQVNFQGTAQDTLLMNNALGGMQKVVTDQFAADDAKKAAALDAQNKLQVQAMKDASDKYTADVAMFGHKNVFDAAIYKADSETKNKLAELDFKTNELMFKAKSEQDLQRIKDEAEFIRAKIKREEAITVQAIASNAQMFGDKIKLQSDREKNITDIEKTKILGTNSITLEDKKNANALTKNSIDIINTINPIEIVEKSRERTGFVGTSKDIFTRSKGLDTIGKINVVSNWDKFVAEGIKNNSFVGKTKEAIAQSFINKNKELSEEGGDTAEGFLWLDKPTQVPVVSDFWKQQEKKRTTGKASPNKLIEYTSK